MDSDLVVNAQFFELYDRMIGDDIDIPSVLQQVADVVCQACNAERATVYLTNEDTMELESVAVIGNIAQSIRVPISARSMTGYCALTGRAFLVHDAYGDLSSIDARLCFDKTWDQLNNFRTRDVMCAPALFKERVMGVVQVINGKEQPFQQEQLLPLQSISRLIGYSLYHSKLYNDLASLKRLDKEKADFMRILVHELKSPVAAARTSIDIINNGYVSEPDDIIAFTKKASARLDQMGDMIGDILTLAKVKSGGTLGEVAVLDLVAETQNSLQLYQDQAREKGLSMEVSLHDGPVPVRFDSQGYRLVLSNLVSNAVKYTPKGAVFVRLIQKDSTAVLEVQDSGIGIPEADLPKLFREFYRASNAKRSNIQGSGVGLAGVKQIVERFGGELRLASRENMGSTFTVCLPLYQE